MTKETTGRVPLRFYWLIFLAAACLRVTLTSLGSFVEDISNDLSLSKAVASLVVTIPTLCMGVCALLATPLSNRIGLERTITLSIFTIAIATFFRTHFSTVMLLILFSFVMGTGIAIVGPLASGFVKRHFGTLSSRGMFLYSLGISVSGVLGTFGTSVLSGYFDLKWPVALELWALPIFLIALFWALYYLRPSGNMANNRGQQEAKAPLPWGNKKAWLLVLCFGLQSGNFYTLVTWLIPYLEEQGVSALHSQILLNLFMLNGILGSFVFPFLLARFRKEVAIYVAAFMLISSIMAILFFFENRIILYSAIFVLGMTANAGMFVIVLTLPFHEVHSGNEIASWTAMMSFGGYVISSMIPTLFGFIYDITNSYANVMWGLLASSILLLGCFLLFSYSKSEKPLQKIHQS
ncbi:MAG: MFS transporter [Xanthomonadaceae bacterium]|nr:MFS transporter [Xanthomonadaceae bacterium]